MDGNLITEFYDLLALVCVCARCTVAMALEMFLLLRRGLLMRTDTGRARNSSRTPFIKHQLA